MERMEEKAKSQGRGPCHPSVQIHPFERQSIPDKENMLDDVCVCRKKDRNCSLLMLI